MTETLTFGLRELLSSDELRQFPTLSKGVPLMIERCQFILLDSGFLCEGIGSFNLKGVKRADLLSGPFDFRDLSELHGRHERTGTRFDLDSLDGAVMESISSTRIRLDVLERAFREAESYSGSGLERRRTKGFYVTEDVYEMAELFYKNCRRDVSVQRKGIYSGRAKGRRPLPPTNRKKRNIRSVARKGKREIIAMKFAKIDATLVERFRENLDMFSTILTYLSDTEGILPMESSYNNALGIIDTALGLNGETGIITMDRSMGRKAVNVRDSRESEGLENSRLTLLITNRRLTTYHMEHYS